MKEFLHLLDDLPETIWFELGDDQLFLDEIDLFAEINTEFDFKTPLSKESFPLLEELGEKIMSKSYVIIDKALSAKLEKAADNINIAKQFNTIGSQILAIPKNTLGYKSGEVVGKILSTRITIEGTSYSAKNLHVISRDKTMMDKLTTLVSENSLTQDSTNYTALAVAYYHYRYDSKISFSDWIDILSKLDLKNSQHSNYLAQILNKNLTAAELKTIVDQINGVNIMASTSPVNSAFHKIREIGLKGMQRGAVGAVNRRFVREVVNRMGDNVPAFLHTTAGQKALEGLLPALAIVAIQFDSQNKIPYKAQIEQVATVALDDWAGNGMSMLVDGITDLIEPFLDEYRRAAEGMSAPEIAQDFEDDDFPTVRAPEKVAVRSM